MVKQISFAPYRFDPQDGCLWRGTRRIQLTRLDGALLGYLASRAGRLVTHAELFSALWPGVTVSAGLLKVRVRRLRRVLGDRASRPRYIETVHGRGYRFIAGAAQVASLREHTFESEAPALGRVRQAVASAMRRQAPHEAIALARTGLALVDRAGDAEGTDVETELRTALGRLQIVRAGYAAPEVLENYAHLRRLCAEHPDDPALFPALVALTRFALNRAEIDTAHELALRTLRIATACRDRWLTGANMLLGAVELNLGRLASADDHLRRALALHDRSHVGALAHVYGENIEVPARGYRAVVAWYLGYPEQALRTSQAAVRAARALRLPAPLAFALGSACWIHRLRHEPAAAREVAEELIALATDHGFPFWLAQGTFELGCALLAGGQDRGRRAMQEGTDLYEAAGARLHQAANRIARIELEGDVARKPAEMLRVLDDLVSAVSASGQRCHEAALRRLQGEALCATGDETGAAVHLQLAIDVAVQQGAKLPELQATVSLGRLWRRRGRASAARALVQRCLRQFTEGFGTRTLREAQEFVNGSR